MSHNVIAINKFWATALSGIFLSTLSGGVVVAKTMYDGLADEVRSRSILEEQIRPIREANLDRRITSLEAQVVLGVNTATRIEAQQLRTDEKIDKILERQHYK